MKRILLVLVAILSSAPALGAGPWFWSGSFAQSLPSSGMKTAGAIFGGATTSDSNLGTIGSVTLNTVYEGTFSATFTGPCSSGALTFAYTKVDHLVTLRVPNFDCTSSSAAVFTSGAGAMPAGLVPSVTLYFPVVADNNGATATTLGLLKIPTTGTMVIGKDNGVSNFTNTGTAGLGLPTAISYLTN